MLPSFIAIAVTAASAAPISLHPLNPHYFLFRGKPTILITSSGHYGQVLNLDFDYVKSLDVLRKDGLNYTRLFTGVYCEDPHDFNIQHNILAPLEGRLICPWARSSTPGYANGGNKFDLKRWDDAYFRRLKDFVDQAGKRGIVVELSLFCPFYGDSMWRLDPMNAANNVNGIGNVPREEVYALKHPDLTAVQEAVTRKLVRELNPYDNIFFEICNEPYFGGVTMEWQRHIADVIGDEESKLAHRHLIAQNIANGSAKVETPHRSVGILNFHYAAPPNAVQENYDLDRVIGFDETGFKGVHDLPYRTEGWDFVMAGGALYDNLDYSFTTAHPDGTEIVVDPTPGGGGPELRKQLAILKRFIERFDFVKMRPLDTVTRETSAGGETAHVLAEPGRAYAAYFRGGGRASLVLDLPSGRYRAEWVDPVTGATILARDVVHAGGELKLESPPYDQDIALRLVRR